MNTLDKKLEIFRESFEKAIEVFRAEEVVTGNELHKIIPVSEYLELQEKAWMYDDLNK